MSKSKKLSKPSGKGNYSVGKVIISKWYVFVLCVAVCAAFVYAYTQLTPTTYKVDASVLIKKDMANETSEKAISKLTSPQLVQKTLTEYHPGVLYYEYSDQVPSFLSNFTKQEAEAFPVIITLSDTANLLSRTLIPITKTGEKDYKITIDGVEVTGTWGQPLNTQNFQLLLERNENSDFKPGSHYAFALVSKEELTNKYVAALDASVQRSEVWRDGLINLSLSHHNPDAAARFINRHIQQYELSKKVNPPMQEVADAGELKARLQLYQDSVRYLSERVAALEKDSLDKSGTLQDRNLRKSLQASQKVALRRVNSYRTLKNNLLGNGSLGKSELLALLAPGDDDLRKWLNANYDGKEELNKLLRSVTDSHPSAIRLMRDIEKSRELAVQKINSLISVEQRKVAALRRRIDTMAPIDPDTQLQDNLQAARLMLASLQTRTDSLESQVLANQKAKADNKALEVIRTADASDAVQVWPSPLLYLLALVLGSLAAWLILWRTNAFKAHLLLDKVELKERAKAPLLGTLSNYSNNKGATTNRTDSVAFAKAMQILTKNLEYISQKSSCKIVGLTSTVAGEGSTFCAANLAISTAQSGSKTLLISLEKGTVGLGKYVEIDHLGVSSQTGNIKELKDDIKPTQFEKLDAISVEDFDDLEAHLFFLRIAEVLRAAREHYEYIFVKTAPILESPLHLDMARYFNVNLLILRYGYSTKDAYEQANDLYLNAEIRNLHIIFNDVKTGKEKTEPVLIKKKTSPLPSESEYQSQIPSKEKLTQTHDRLNNKTDQETVGKREEGLRPTSTASLPEKPKQPVYKATGHSSGKRIEPLSKKTENVPVSPKPSVERRTEVITELKKGIQKDRKPQTAALQKETNGNNYAPEAENPFVRNEAPSKGASEKPISDQKNKPDPGAPDRTPSVKDEKKAPEIMPNPLREEIERKRLDQMQKNNKDDETGDNLSSSKSSLSQDGSEKGLYEKPEEKLNKPDPVKIPIFQQDEEDENDEDTGFFQRLFGKKKPKKNIYKNPFA